MKTTPDQLAKTSTGNSQQIRHKEYSEIEKCILYCSALIGLKPEAFEIKVLSRFIKKNFAHLTIEQIIEAFELNSTGKHWKIIKPFGSFNSLFAGDILKHYDDFNKQRIINEKKSLPEPQKDYISYEEAKPYLDKMTKNINKLIIKQKKNKK